MVLALFGTPLAIRIFSRRGYGQEIREDGPTAHLTKRGTPTMAARSSWSPPWSGTSAGTS